MGVEAPKYVQIENLERNHRNLTFIMLLGHKLWGGLKNGSLIGCMVY